MKDLEEEMISTGNKYSFMGKYRRKIIGIEKVEEEPDWFMENIRKGMKGGDTIQNKGTKPFQRKKLNGKKCTSAKKRM